MTHLRMSVAAATALVIFVAGCGSKPLAPEEQLARLVEEGWQRYAAGQYAVAEARFREAAEIDAADAATQIGLGWAFLRQNRLSDATTALSRVSSGAGTNYVHAQAALALVYDAQAAFDRSIVAADAALARDSSYAFLHDERVNWRDLCYLLAKNYLVLSAQADPNLTSTLRFLKRVDGGAEIVRTVPTTWTAGDKLYATPAEAVLKRLESIQVSLIDAPP